jgi:hypothetical protein
MPRIFAREGLLTGYWIVPGGAGIYGALSVRSAI